MASSTASNQPYCFNPAAVYKPPPTFKQVAVTPILPSSKLVTLAGQTGTDATTGKVVTGGIKEQARVAYQHVHNCLIAAGATPRDIVSVRHYIVQNTGDPEVDKTEVTYRGWGPLWMEYLDREADGHRPPDTEIGVACLALTDLLYEVEVVALVHG